MITITESHVERARKLGACEDGLRAARKLVGSPAKKLPLEYLVWWARKTDVRLPAKLESVLLERGSGVDLSWYAYHVIHGRWPAAEDVLLEQGCGDDLYRYARYVIGGRWPEAEDVLLENVHVI